MIYAFKLNNGSWRSCVDAGVSVVSRTLRHAGVDILNLTVVGQTVSTDDLSFTYGTTLTLARFQDSDTSFSGTPEYLFTGRITDVSRRASGENEGYNVLISGPWEILEKTIYRQEWMESDTSSVYAPHCVLYYGGWDSENQHDIRMNTIEQIEDVLSCGVESSPAAFQFDSSTFPSSGHYPPFDERLNMTCAEAIRTALSNHPNLLLYFDHSTNPPTCRVKMRNDLSATSFSLSSLASIDVRKRDDLIPSAVSLAYIYTDTISGKTYTHTVFDYAPVVSGETEEQKKARLYAPDVLWGTFEMQGMNAEYAEQKYTVDPILWNSVLSNSTYAKSFFQDRCPEIKGYTIDSISVDTNFPPTYPNFLIEGAVQNWQNKHTASDTFKASAVGKRYGNAPSDNTLGSIVVEKKDVELSFTATTTDLGGDSLVQRHTGTDRKMMSYDSGEIVPYGFADALYNEWQIPQYEGSITIIDQDTPSNYFMGKVLNISGGRTEWLTMNALITEVSEDFGSGTLNIGIGTTGWIDVNSRVAWMRNCYNRRYSWRRNIKDKGQEAEGNTIGIEGTPNSEGGSPVADYRRLVLFNPSNQNTNGITLDPDLIQDGTGKVIQPRKIKVLMEDPTTHKTVSANAWVLCTEPISDGGTVGGGYRVRYNLSNHQLQETLDNGTTWTCLQDQNGNQTGGQAVPEGGN